MLKKVILLTLFGMWFTIALQASPRKDSLDIAVGLRMMENRVPMTYNEVTLRFINQYLSAQKGRFARVLAAAPAYFPLYEKIFKDRNVPVELKYISVIESSLNPNALSPVGAAGLWQFMAGTARAYGLTVSDFQDDRKDAAKACNAAASFLLDSYLLYDDWLLAIASYNCGRNNIRWAIDKSGGKKDFWAIRDYLPIETRSYVPAFIATAYILENARQYSISPSGATPASPSELPLKETSKVDPSEIMPNVN